MTDLSREILEKWQVRKSARQKIAFYEFLKTHLPGLVMEEGGFIKSRNLVLGDPASAKLILTAHYDTCARLPFPNFITPKNMFWYIGYQLLIVIPFLAVFFACLAFLPRLGLDFMLSYWLGFLLMMGGMVYMFMLGPANPHTANDNTSGVIQLCEIYAALTPEEREKVCFVFFDNEENGLLGSSAFKSMHKKDKLDEKLLLNFDCVSDGNLLLIAINKKVKQQYGAQLEGCFRGKGEKIVEITTSAFYPSDQANYKLGVGVASLKHSKVFGYYMDRIHTKHDTVFDERNIHHLTACTKQLAQML